MPSDTSKIFFSFPCIELLGWFTWPIKSAKKSNLAIYSSSLKRSKNLCFCSFKKMLISFRRLATLSITFSLDTQRMLEWNRNPLCSTPISSHNTRNKRVCKGRDLIKLTTDTTSLKTMARSPCISFAVRFSLWIRQ